MALLLEINVKNGVIIDVIFVIEEGDLAFLHIRTEGSKKTFRLSTEGENPDENIIVVPLPPGKTIYSALFPGQITWLPK